MIDIIVSVVVIILVVAYISLMVVSPLLCAVLLYRLRRQAVATRALMVAAMLSFAYIGAPFWYEIMTGYWAPTWMDPFWKQDCRRSGHPCPCAFCGGGAPG